MFSFLGRLIKRLVRLAIFAAIGETIVILFYQGEGGAGAVLGAGLVLAYWFLGWLFRLIFRGTSKAQLATIVDISNEAPPGAPWYHHAYVLFDIKGKRHKLKLTPEQARYFADHYSINDTGRLKWAGKKLIEFKLPMPDNPLKASSNLTKGRKVFISYARGDDPGGQTADYMEQVFSSAGLETWVDKNELAPGDKLREKIEKRILETTYFVPILTPMYMSSPWCLREFELAADNEIRIIPVKTTLDRLVPPPDMRKLFDEKAGEPKYLDLTTRGYLDELRQLVNEMTGRSR